MNRLIYHAAFQIARFVVLENPLHRHHQRRETLQRLGSPWIQPTTLRGTRGRIKASGRTKGQSERL